MNPVNLVPQPVNVTGFLNQSSASGKSFANSTVVNQAGSSVNTGTSYSSTVTNTTNSTTSTSIVTTPYLVQSQTQQQTQPLAQGS